MDSTSFKTSLGKKLIAVALCVTAFVFLSFSVFGAGAGVQATAYDSDTVSGVSIITNAYKLYNNAWGTTALPGGSYFPIYISMQIFNNNDEAALVNSVGFTLDLGYGPSGLYNIINYSNDLMISWTSGLFSVSPSNDYSYGNGIVVPPKESLYLIAEIQISVNWDTSTQSWPNTYLNGITNNTYNVGLGDYPYPSGSASDLSPVINVLNNIDGNTDDIETLISNLVNVCSYTGSTNTNNYLNAPAASTISGTINNVDYVIDRIPLKPYHVSKDTELINSSDTYVSEDTYCMPIIVQIILDNKNQHTGVWSNQYFAINSMGYGYAYEYTLYSDLFQSNRINPSYPRTVQLKFQNQTSTGSGLIPPGTHVTVLVLKYYYDGTPSLTLYDPSLITRNISINEQYDYDFNTDYHLYSIDKNLKELLDAYSSVNGLDDIDDAAEDITDKSESAHTQEQSYFTQNAQAIQATGLSNYRFNSDQQNGIGSVSNDFMLLWNSLGGFNSVYVFSLTLSLALMILRHAPNALKSSRRSKEE